MKRWFLLVGLVCAPLAAEVRVVCVGVEQYDHAAINPVPHAVADARAVADAYRAAEVPADRVALLVSDATDRRLLPTKSNVLEALRKAREAGRAGDVLVLYFAGHGTQEGTGSCLWTLDTDPELVADTSLSTAAIRAKLQGFQGSDVVLLLDACRTATLAARASAVTPLDERFARGLRTIVQAPAKAVAPRLTTLLACQPGQRAWAMPDQRHGVFTFYLLEGLRRAALDPAGEVGAAALAAYVAQGVADWASRNQTAQTPDYGGAAPSPVIFRLPASQRPRLVQGALTLITEPAGAAVYLDGVAVGLSPVTAAVALPASGPLKVRLDVLKTGYEPVVRTVTVRAETTAEVVVLLRPADRGAQAWPAGWPESLRAFKLPPARQWAEYRVCEQDGMPQALVTASDGQGAWWVDLHEVTVAQYRRYARAVKQALPAQPAWSSEDHAVVNVTWQQARDYAAWAGRRLPTADEWDVLRRAGDRRAEPYRWLLYSPAIASDNACFGGRAVGRRTTPTGQGPADLLLTVGPLLPVCRYDYNPLGDTAGTVAAVSPRGL